MLVHATTCILLISICLSSQIPSILQNILIPNANGTSLNAFSNAMTVTSVANAYKNFISQGAKKPEAVTKILLLLEDLVKEAEGNINVLEAKVTSTKITLDGVTRETDKKVASAKQAHDDAKQNRDTLNPGFNKDIKTLKTVIGYLWPLSTRSTKPVVGKWQNCDSVKECGAFGKSVCIGGKKGGVRVRPWNIVKNLIPGQTYTLTMDYLNIDTWDGEFGQVFVNDKECWRHQFGHTKSDNKCTQHGYIGRNRMTCNVVASDQGVLKIQGRSNLDSDIADESFGVSNLKLKLKV